MYTSIKINNYKCFIADNESQGFDIIKPINVIIGKNNSGKSKLLEVLGELVTKGYEELPFNGSFKKQLEEDELLRTFRCDAFNSGLCRFFNKNGSEWDLIGRYLVGKVISFTLKNRQISNKYICENVLQLPNDPYLSDYIQYGIDRMSLISPFKDYRFLHLRAERDIGQEPILYDNDISQSSIMSNADGICGLISRMLMDAEGNDKGWQQYIEKEFLNIINTIVAPTIKFTRINTKTSQNNLYEIYLEEENKGGIKLSDCGSGLKTIIATLTLLHIIPYLTGSYKNVFALEELENNLHPSLERKLLRHIQKYSEEHPEVFIFLTTHSNVALDMFGKDFRSQIVRVCNNGYRSIVETVISNSDKQTLLDDLGAKASDLLQANCIIWVEGPSDRIYIKKWIDLFSDDQLEEGLQYQFICYGGALLSNYTAGGNKDLIDLLKVNRHSYVVMDSDKKSDEAKLKERVKRISKELKDSHWITNGKEIENYLPEEALTDYFGQKINIKKNASFSNLYKKVKNVKTFDKISFASEITKNKNYTRDNLSKCLDLEQKINELMAFIKKSNDSNC